MRWAVILTTAILLFILLLPCYVGNQLGHAAVAGATPSTSNVQGERYYAKYTEYLNNSSMLPGNVNPYSDVPGPAALLFDASSNTFFVASGISSIYSINATSFKTSLRSSVGDFPAAFSYDSKNRSLFFLPGQNNLTRWNLTTGALENLSVGSYPQSLAFDPRDSTMFVTVQGVDSLVAVNTTSFNVSYTLPLRFGPFGVEFDPHSGLVYISYPDAGLVSVFNPEDRQFVMNITIGGSPYMFATNPQSNIVYVTNQGLNQLDRIDGTTQQLTGTLSVGYNPTGITFDSYSSTIFVANTDSLNVTAINPDSWSVTQNIDVGLQPYAVASDSMNGAVMVGNHGSNSLSLLFPVKNNDVTFSEIGLPIGSLWHVTVNGATRFSDTNNISFDLPGGTVNYTVSGAAGYYIKSSGTVMIGGNTDLVIRYNSIAALHNEILTVGISAALIIAISGLWFIFRKRRMPGR